MTINKLPQGRSASDLVLTFAGNVVKHLGVQMYAGRPVPAIAELISNAWDADARTVRVSLPLSKPWTEDSLQTIQVEDDGHGMSWEMVRDAYLDVGRDRRSVEGTDRSPGGRRLQGRKGIGKLAGFGIADIVEVQTAAAGIDKEFGGPVLIWFRLALDELKKAGRQPSAVDLVYAGLIEQAPEGGRTERGTTVILRSLHGKRAINKEQFMRSMSRRFLLQPGFRVTINGDDLEAEDFPLEWRYPETGWAHDEVPGCGVVEYWVGFSGKPLKQDEGDLSGLLIYTRQKVSQEATFFEISGGVTGQHGLRYMCGMIKAEWLDEGAMGSDLIATHRGSIAWESPQGHALQEWGQALVRKHLREWAERRSRTRKKQVMEVSARVKAKIERLAPAYQRVAERFVENFKDVEMEPSEFEELLLWFLDALENATLRNIIDKLRLADRTDLRRFDELLERMEIRTAATLLQIIESNLAAIDALEDMHGVDARERDVLSKHLARNPWLIHPSWMLHRVESRVATWVREEFGLADEGARGGRDRADFICLGVGGTLHIVEIKRGRHEATNEDILQANKYREYIERRYSELNDPEALRYGNIQSHLIAARLRDDASSAAEAFRAKAWVFFTTWEDLIERAQHTHAQFRDALRKVAETSLPEEAED